MKRLNNLLLGAGITALSFLPLKSLSQDIQEKEKSDYNAKFGISMQDQHGYGFKEYFGSIFGIYVSMSKPIAKEIKGSLHVIYSWEKNKKEKVKQSVFEVGPHIEWHPTFGESKWFYVGGGFKYKTVTVTDTEDNYKEYLDGIGLSILFGSDIQVGKKGNYINLETGYDKVKGEFDGEEINLGSTRFTISFGF